MRLQSPLLALVAASLCLAYNAQTVNAQSWKPVDASELSLRTPVVEKDADAEALFWEVRIDDHPDGDLIFNHYIRVKVFNDRGREAQGRVELPFGRIYRLSIRVQDIAARTIKQNGSIIELKKSDIYDQEKIRTSGLKFKVKSFALPGVEAGDIVEYRWREIRSNQSAHRTRLHFQRDIPVQTVRYYIKPYPFPGLGMRAFTNRGADPRFVPERNGFHSVTMTNMPAFREEPNMPPEDAIRTWTLVYYTKDTRVDPATYWADHGKEVFNAFKPYMKVNDVVRNASAEAIGDAASPEDKLKRLYGYVRNRITNSSDPASGFTPEQRAKLKENKSPADTLKRGVGNSQDIDLLFAALAIAAGFDARVALFPDRSDYFFDRSVAIEYFLNHAHIAIRVGDQWRFFNPGYHYLPYGMLSWEEEFQEALITDPRSPVFVRTPLASPDASKIRRTAKLRLTDDGSLEGDVRIEYTGHAAMQRKGLAEDDTPAEQEQSLKNSFKNRMSTAELSSVRIENMGSAEPLIQTFKVRVPGYAQRTGRRLFLQPAFFQHGAKPLFTASDRRHDIYFDYPWSEEDEVTIELPAGYEFDNAEAPVPFQALPITKYDVKIMAGQNLLVYKRSFFFGGDNNLLFPVQSYRDVKLVFDTVQERDGHTITLRQAGGN